MRYGLPLLFCVSLGAACLHGAPAHAQMIGQLNASADSAAASAPSNKYSPSHRFFVEFRARNAASYGHMYVMYGEVNERHEVIRSEIAGFFPAGDSRTCENCSVYNWTIGHVVPVASEIGASDGDLEEQYVLARYRVWIDAAQYKKLVAYIKQRKAHLGPWHAFLNNCVTFGRDVAVFLNLHVPPLMRIRAERGDVSQGRRRMDPRRQQRREGSGTAQGCAGRSAGGSGSQGSRQADAGSGRERDRQHRRRKASSQEAACQPARREQGNVCDPLERHRFRLE